MEARRAWYAAAIAAFTVAAVTHTRAWFTDDRMPPGDFPGYAAQVQYVRDSLLELGRVPRWCVECYGGTTNFTSNLKEYLVFPLAVAFDSVTATKIAFVLLRWIAAFGLFVLVTRELRAPAVGIAAGYAFSYCATANFEMEHLDVAVAAAILPFLWLSAVELLRGGGARWAVALGVAMACQLANNWVHAATAPLAVIGLALVRPWRRGDGDRPPWRDRALARRWAMRGLAAFAVFCAFAASSVTWLASDARNHGLMSSQAIELQRTFYVERSPFLFANRDGVLTRWLETHSPPPYQALVTRDQGARYLGGVLVAVIALGAWIARRDPVLRRWAALAGLAWLLQYWLALGPRTLSWEVLESLRFAPETQARAIWALRAAAALFALAGVALAVWPRCRGRGAISARAPLLLATAVVCLFPTASLWSACARWLPMFAVQRSPGHFFDTAPFALSLLFAACLAALAQRVARSRLAHAVAIAVAAALVVDYWPSTKIFTHGEPLAPLRQSAALVADLPGDGGMARIGLGPRYSPLSSWLLAHSRAGHAWGWIFWQASRYWREAYAFAAFGERNPGGAPPWSERYAPLLGAARVRYVLVQTGSPPPPEPWRPVRRDARFALWERPDVAPMAQAYRAWVLWTGDDPSWAAPAATDALRANALLVAPPADAVAADALRAGASSVLAGEPSSPLLASPAPLAADLRRPAPERIEVDLDAGGAPALVFVSEGYHPWWRAEVDGRHAPVLRASIAHMAVPVGPGRHAVELRLVRPLLVAAADALTAAAWVVLVVSGAAVVVGRIRGRRPETRPTS